jgi:hypothetical protein
MDSPDRYRSNVAFIDLLFNILVGFVFLFVIAFILINPKAKQGDIVSPAQFLITMTWPNDLNEDMDLWIQDPAGNVVGFLSKDKGIMNLDRDDLGITNDEVTVNGERIKVLLNQEVISLRGIMPGEYFVSVHYYRHDATTKPITFNVTVAVTKINPYAIIYKQDKTFNTEGQIQNYYSFKIDNTGYVSEVRDSNISVVPKNHRSSIQREQPRRDYP